MCRRLAVLALVLVVNRTCPEAVRDSMVSLGAVDKKEETHIRDYARWSTANSVGRPRIKFDKLPKYKIDRPELSRAKRGE